MVSVLYVDDEPDLCELAKLFLEQSPEFSVITHTSAKEALSSMDLRSCDAIVSDYQMPDMDGIQFLRSVRSTLGNIPFILFTGRGREEIVIQAINFGADFYLQKGGDPGAQYAELAHKIRIAVERREAKDALKDSEQRLAGIISFLPDATFAIDRAGTVIAWNRAIEEMSGVMAADVLGKGDFEYSIPFYGGRRPILIDLVLSKDETIRQRYTFIQEKEDKYISEIFIPHLYGGRGAYLWFIASPLYDSDGVVVGAIESIRDITIRKKAEDALKDSEQRLNDIIDFLPDATFAIDRSGTVIMWNRPIEEMTGVSAADMLGKGNYEYAIPFYGSRRKILIDLIYETDEIIATNYAHILHEKDTLIAETTLPRPKGEKKILMGKASPLYNRQGEVVGAIEAIRDITGLRMAEGLAIDTRKDWETIFRAIGHPAIVLDADNHIIDANDATVRVSGLSLDQLKGKRCYEVFHDPGTDRPPEFCPFDQLRSTGSIEPSGAEIAAMGGYYHISCTPVFDAAGNLEKVIHIAMDVTGQRRARNDLQAAYEQISASEEELRGQFEALVESEQRFRESEAKYRELADMLPQVVFEMDLGMRVTYANRYALFAFGLTGQDLAAGIEGLRLIVPEDHDRIRKNLEKVLRGEEYDDHEYTAVRSDGTIFPVLIYSAPFYLDGRPAGLRGVIIDISSRKKTEAELRDREAMLAAIFRVAPVGFLLVKNRVIMSVNDKICLISGYSQEELTGRNARMLYGSDEDFEFVGRTNYSRDQLYGLDAIETRWAMKDGMSRNILLSGTPLDPARPEFEWIIVALDITRQKQMETEIRQSQQQLDNLMQNLPVGVFRTTTTLPGKRIMVNPVLAQMFGYDSVEEFMQSSLEESYADPGGRRAFIDTLSREGFVSNAEVRFRKKNGELFWASISAVMACAPDGSPEYLDGVLTDITARKRAEDALHEANRRSKLLTSMTRHDMLNQLTALRGFVQVATTKTVDPDLGGYLDKIQRITGTISSQLEFTRAYQELGINVPSWLRLRDVLANAAHGFPVSVSPACNAVGLFADPMLERAFFNLFENAIRHGGRVTAVTVQCRQGPEGLCIVVEDDGTGIPAADKEKIFLRGFGKNTGLGLFLVQEILAITGIGIRETGTPGSGARFVITVPKGVFRVSS